MCDMEEIGFLLLGELTVWGFDKKNSLRQILHPLALL